MAKGCLKSKSKLRPLDQRYCTKEKYEKELRENKDQKQAFNDLQDIIANSKQDVVLLYSAKDKQHNQAIVLQEILQ